MKRAFTNVKDEIAEHRRLYIGLMLWCVVNISVDILGYLRIYNGYGIAVCAADLLLLLQRPWELGIKIMPFLMFVIMRSKNSKMNMQCLVRYRSRKKMFRTQVAESAVYAMGFTVLFAGVITVLALIARVPLVNWDSRQSLFCARTEWMISESYWKIMLAAGAMYFIKIFIDCIVLDLMLWYPKCWVLFWVFLIVQAAMEMNEPEKEVFYQFFEVRYPFWGVAGKHGLIFVIGILVVALEYLFGSILVEKRDFYK